MNPVSTEDKTRKLLRFNALAAGALSVVAGLSFFCGNFPFHPSLGWLAIISSVFYFCYFLLFDRICRSCYRGAGIALSQYGVFVVTMAVCVTGGVLSPFTFLYIALLVSESLYGLENPYTMPASVAGYLLVVAGLHFGFIPNYAPWSAGVYLSPAAVLAIAMLVSGYIAITGSMSGRIVNNLREMIEREGAEKDVLLKKFAELNATTQLGVLAHRIAHDMRGPIASISGYLEMEAAKEQSPEDRKTLRDVQETVDAMVESLHGITRFGKPGGPSCEKIMLADLMKDLVGIASFAPMARGVKFGVVPGEGQDLCVTASRADLQQAFFNILKNAVEAVADNPDCRNIDIIIRRVGGEASVSLSDNGPGVTEETLKSLFRKSVTTKADGTGVGLMITRDLLIRNKGDIKLRNREGGGFTAEVSLPLA